MESMSGRKKAATTINGDSKIIMLGYDEDSMLFYARMNINIKTTENSLLQIYLNITNNYICNNIKLICQ